jgi:hypothetical protein
MPDPIWSRAGIDMTWRGYGLYLGNLFVGSVSQPFETWDAHLNLRRLGSNFPTEQAARDAVVDAAIKALLGENG